MSCIIHLQKCEYSHFFHIAALSCCVGQPCGFFSMRLTMPLAYQKTHKTHTLLMMVEENIPPAKSAKTYTFFANKQ